MVTFRAERIFLERRIPKCTRLQPAENSGTEYNTGSDLPVDGHDGLSEENYQSKGKSRPLQSSVSCTKYGKNYFFQH